MKTLRINNTTTYVGTLVHIRHILDIHDIPHVTVKRKLYIECDCGGGIYYEPIHTLNDMQSFLYDNY